MNKLYLKNYPISEEQLAEEFKDIIEQLTGLQFKYMVNHIDYIEFRFEILGDGITKETLQILDDLDCDYCGVYVDIPYVNICVEVEWRFGSRKMYLYQIIGDLLFDYVRAVDRTLKNEEEYMTIEEKEVEI